MGRGCRSMERFLAEFWNSRSSGFCQPAEKRKTAMSIGVQNRTFRSVWSEPRVPTDRYPFAVIVNFFNGHSERSIVSLGVTIGVEESPVVPNRTWLPNQVCERGVFFATAIKKTGPLASAGCSHHSCSGPYADKTCGSGQGVDISVTIP
ncbi:MAG TPA: hypothetical protein VGM92_14820 [Candidatus Kapabacteria bacterium]